MGGIDNEMTTLVVPLTVAGAVLIASFLIVNATDYSHQHTSKVSAKAGYEVLSLMTGAPLGARVSECSHQMFFPQRSTTCSHMRTTVPALMFMS